MAMMLNFQVVACRSVDVSGCDQWRRTSELQAAATAILIFHLHEIYMRQFVPHPATHAPAALLSLLFHLNPALAQLAAVMR
jgi:hypothetical protein